LVICDVLPEDPGFWSDPFTQAIYVSGLLHLNQRDPFGPDTCIGHRIEGYCQSKGYPPFIVYGGYNGYKCYNNPQPTADVKLRFVDIRLFTQ
jgi:hypothetical protein